MAFAIILLLLTLSIFLSLKVRRLTIDLTETSAAYNQDYHMLSNACDKLKQEKASLTRENTIMRDFVETPIL